MLASENKNRDFSNELFFLASKSSGPGGQHVNKSNTKIELRFDIQGSQLLSEEEKEMLMAKLSAKINNEGILIITSQTERSQLRNKEIAIEKFYRLINAALKPDKKRKKSPPFAYCKGKKTKREKKNFRKEETSKRY